MLQFHIANYSALLAKYDFDNYRKLFEFTMDIPEDRRAQFKSVLIEGQLVTRMALQASLDIADTAAHAMAIVRVMCRALWLLSSGIQKDHQLKDEGLPFDKDKLFLAKNDEVLHTVKDSVMTPSYTWHIYTTPQKEVVPNIPTKQGFSIHPLSIQALWGGQTQK